MFELLEELKREILVILMAAMPIVQLRGGAIPLGISLGLSPIHSTIISIIGNMAIVPILLKILNPVMNYLEKKPSYSLNLLVGLKGELWKGLGIQLKSIVY